jgi:DNA polymerase-3 subunit alpha
MVGGIISGLKNMSTRKGEPMARFELGTASGAGIGAVIFPSDFATYRELIANDRVVLVRGRVDRTNDPPGVKASEVIPIDQADSRLARKVFIDLPGESVGEDVIEALADLCRRHPGRVPVFFRIRLAAAKALLAAGRAFCVFPSQALVDDCAQILGSGRVSFAGGPLVSNGNGSGNGYPRRRRPNGF